MCAGGASKKKRSTTIRAPRLPEVAAFALLTLLCLLERTPVVLALGQHQHLLQRRLAFGVRPREKEKKRERERERERKRAERKRKREERAERKREREREREKTTRPLRRFGCAANVIEVEEVEKEEEEEDELDNRKNSADGTFEEGRRGRGGGTRGIVSRMTATRTLIGLSRLLVLVPVTLCATISFPDSGFNSEDFLKCNDRRSPPQTLAQCRYDDDCMENAYCWSQKACYCKDDYVVYRNRSNVYCLKVAKNHKDPCVADVQCQVTFTPNSECRNNVCQCSSTAHFVNERCYESISLGRICQTNHNCYVNGSYCVGGYCICDHGQHSNPDRTKCIKNAYLGDTCKNDYECVSENTRCMEICTCKVDYVISDDGTRCLKAANSVGEACQENSQCREFLQNAVCENEVCSCLPKFHRRGPVCAKDVKLGQYCISHNECITQTYKDSNSIEMMNVDCQEGVCTCAKDYILSKELGDCVRYSESGATNWQAYGILSLIILVNVSLWILQRTTQS